MISIDVRDYSGDYYDIGLAHGRWLQNSEQFQALLAKVKDFASEEQNTEEIRTILTTFCPQLLEELKGIADGMMISENEALRWFAGYDLPALEMGCTSFITSEYYVRNYDFSPDIYDGTFLIQRHSENKWTCGNSELVVGRLDGMNSNGLTCGLHFVNNDTHKKGFLGSTIVRIIVETCNTVEDAIELLKELPHAASYNFSLVDRNGEFAIFEASPEQTNVYREKNSISCVNMFQTDQMKHLNRQNVSSSVDRLHALANLSEATRPAGEVHNWFSDPASPVFYTDYENYFGTLHTVSYVPKANTVEVTSSGGETQYIKM